MDRKRDRKELARRKPLAGSVSDISIHSGTLFFLETLPISVMTIIFIPHFFYHEVDKIVRSSIT
jgi:hypothetical protein